MNRNKVTKKKAVVTAMAGILAVGGIMGASAFFTDQAHIDAKAHVGGLNMTVEDLSDLDGDYSNWDIDQATGAITEKDSVIDTAIGVTDGVAVTPTDRFKGNYTGRVVTEGEVFHEQGDQTSTGIINPGDSGLLQFKVGNYDSKSFRTGVESNVIVMLAKDAKEPDGETAATLSAEHKKGFPAGTVSMAYPDGTTITNEVKYAVADYDAYTIEGMGAPIVAFGHSEDGKTFEKVADPTAEGAKTVNAMQLTYYTELDTLKGSQEQEANVDGTEDKLTYAFETKFDRLAQNKFQGAQIDIKTDLYALQNRKTAGTWYSVTANDDATKNTRVDATGDWTQIGSFEKVINTQGNVVDNDMQEDANTGVLNA